MRAFITFYFNSQNSESPMKLLESRYLNNTLTTTHTPLGAVIARCMVLALRQSDRSVPGLQSNSVRMRGTKRGLTGRQRYSDVGGRGGGRLIKVITKPQLVTLSHREGGKNKESKHPGASIPHLGHMEDVEWAAHIRLQGNSSTF